MPSTRGATVCRVRLVPYRLPLRRPWITRAGGWSVRQGWLLCIDTADGPRGYGDCAPLPEAGTEPLGVAEARLNDVVAWVVGLTPEEALDGLDAWRDAPAVRCAVECALLDVVSQGEGILLARWLAPGAAPKVAVNAVLGRLSDDVELRARAAIDRGFRVLKLKLGVAPLDTEIERLRALSAILPEGVGLRLDANGSWDEAQARDALSSLRGASVESLEEPLAAPNRSALSRLQALVPWPIALDESLARWPIEDLIGHPPVQRLVLKPMALGGALPAMAWARRAQLAGLSTVVTTTVDSAAGVRLALHLAAALGGDRVHGLATSDWLAEDLGDAPTVAAGEMAVGEAPGLGFSPYDSLPAT